MNIQGKTVVITGASNGIGLAIATALAEQGAHIYSFDKHEPHISHENITHVEVDVTCERDVQAAIASMSVIDILILNAGVMRRGTICETTHEEFDLLIDVALKGTWLLLKYAQPILSPTATIMQVMSRYALEPPLDPGIYGATKKMQLVLIELMEKTYPTYDYRFLFPGPTDTDLARHDVAGDALVEKEKIMSRPEDLAKLVVEMLLDEKKTLLYNENTHTHYLA